MKKCLILILFYLMSCVSDNSVTIEGTIIEVNFDIDFNFRETNAGYSDFYYSNTYNSDNYIFEILVKIDEGIFNKYYIVIANDTILVNKSDFVNNDALQDFYLNNTSINNFNLNIINDYPNLLAAINLQIEYIREILLKRYQWDEVWLTFRIIDFEYFNNTVYFIIGFVDSHNSLGSIFYALDFNGEILIEKSLAEDITQPTFSSNYNKILSSNKLITFLSEGNMNTRISIIAVEHGDFK